MFVCRLYGRSVFARLRLALELLFGLGAYCALLSLAGIGCPVKWLTGVSCAGCGMTRAVAYALTLRFDKAVYYHPLVVLLPLFALFFLFWERIPKNVRKWAAWAAVACFAAVYVIRLAGDDHAVVGVDLKSGAAYRALKSVERLLTK